MLTCSGNPAVGRAEVASDAPDLWVTEPLRSVVLQVRHKRFFYSALVMCDAGSVGDQAAVLGGFTGVRILEQSVHATNCCRTDLPEVT